MNPESLNPDSLKYQRITGRSMQAVIMYWRPKLLDSNHDMFTSESGNETELGMPIWSTYRRAANPKLGDTNPGPALKTLEFENFEALSGQNT